MKKIFIYYNESYCIRRALDARKIYTYLVKNNYIVTNNPADSDVIIFVTCASLDTATEFSLNKIKEFQKYDAELIVAGCLPAIAPEKLKEIFNGNTLCTKDIDEIEELFPGDNVDFKSLEDANQTLRFINRSNLSGSIENIFNKSRGMKNLYIKLRNHIIKNLFGKYSRFYKWVSLKKSLFLIRISWGCSSNCAYCGIKNAIGPLKSKPFDICMQEFQKGLKQGYTNFVINADEIGSYGLDIGSSFAELLDKLTLIPGDYKISISDLSPRWAVKYLEEIERILKRGKIVRMDIPLQSGNERILKLMHRYSNIEQIKQMFIRFKKAHPDLIIDTRLILGFPSETENEFVDTLKIIKEIDFFSGYIYPFSLKKDTEAEKIEPKITNEEMKKGVRLAKKILKNMNYNFIRVPKKQFYLFEKRIKK